MPQASRRDFLKKAFQKKVHYFLIPQSTHFVRSQLPLQGSLNNPSVCSRCSQPAPDGSPSPLSLRDVSQHRGESPYLREPFLSLRDISPHRGESPNLREVNKFFPSPYLSEAENGFKAISAVERDIYAKNPRFLPKY